MTDQDRIDAMVRDHDNVRACNRVRYPGDPAVYELLRLLDGLLYRRDLATGVVTRTP